MRRAARRPRRDPKAKPPPEPCSAGGFFMAARSCAAQHLARVRIHLNLRTRVGPADFRSGAIDASLVFGDGRRPGLQSDFVPRWTWRPTPHRPGWRASARASPPPRRAPPCSTTTRCRTPGSSGSAPAASTPRPCQGLLPRLPGGIGPAAGTGDFQALAAGRGRARTVGLTAPRTRFRRAGPARRTAPGTPAAQCPGAARTGAAAPARTPARRARPRS